MKFGKNSSSCPALVGYASDADASAQFADMFANICKPNIEPRNEYLKQEFISRYQNYSVDSQTNISVELIDRCIMIIIISLHTYIHFYPAIRS